MFDASKGNISKATYWLSTIKVRAKNLPIVVVGTHVDKCDSTSIKELTERIKTEWSSFNITYCAFVSSKTRAGIKKLKHELVKIALNKKMVGTKISKKWLGLSEVIINMR